MALHQISHPNSVIAPAKSTRITSVELAFEHSQITIPSITNAANAKDAMSALSKLTYSDYSVKAKAHAEIISALCQSLPQEEKIKFINDLKTLYFDYGYLGTQVRKHLSEAIRTEIFGTPSVPAFKSELYDELKRSQLSYAPISVVVVAINQQNAQSIAPQIQQATSAPASSNKERYLKQIATTGMLGYHELQPLANLIGRPIVVVRQEALGDKQANNVEIIAKPNQPQAADPVYVQNSKNCHFRTFVPDAGQNPVAGQSLQGHAIEGDYQGAGVNDCLIASLRKGGANFKQLSNQSIRNYCVAYANHYLSNDVFIPESEVASRIVEFKSIDQIPKGYVGFVLIKQNDEHYFQGQYNNGPVGEWELLTSQGKYKLTYNDAHQLTSAHKTGEWGTHGNIILTDVTQEERPNSHLIPIQVM